MGLKTEMEQLRVNIKYLTLATDDFSDGISTVGEVDYWIRQIEKQIKHVRAAFELGRSLKGEKDEK